MLLATQEASAPQATTRWERLRAPVTGVAGLALATLALHLRDPHVSGSWGFCPSNALLGLYCPGCGGLRAVNDLTHLDLGAAASSNLLFVALVPLIAWVAGRTLLAAWRGEPYAASIVLSSRVFGVLGVVTIAFMVARNLPAGAWLAP